MPPRSQRTLVYGIHASQAQMESDPERVVRVYVERRTKKAKVAEIANQARSLGISVAEANPATMNKHAKGGVHQGILLECLPQKLATEEEFRLVYESWDNPFLLALDSVQDPHNLGACLRTAAAVGVDAVILPRSRTASIDGIVQKTSSGLLQSVYIAQVANLVRSLEWLKLQGCWVVGTDSQGSREYTDIDLRIPLVLVIGGEQSGLRSLTLRTCDHVVNIPMTNNVESLNLSVANGILLFEVRRQRTLS